MSSIKRTHGHDQHQPPGIDQTVKASKEAEVAVEFPTPLPRSRFHRPATVASASEPGALTAAERKQGADLVGD